MYCGLNTPLLLRARPGVFQAIGVPIDPLTAADSREFVYPVLAGDAAILGASGLDARLLDGEGDWRPVRVWSSARYCPARYRLRSPENGLRWPRPDAMHRYRLVGRRGIVESASAAPSWVSPSGLYVEPPDTVMGWAVTPELAYALLTALSVENSGAHRCYYWWASDTVQDPISPDRPPSSGWRWVSASGRVQRLTQLTAGLSRCPVWAFGLLARGLADESAQQRAHAQLVESRCLGRRYAAAYAAILTVSVLVLIEKAPTGILDVSKMQSQTRIVDIDVPSIWCPLGLELGGEV